MPVLPKEVVKELQSYAPPDEGRYSSVRLDFMENTSGFPDAYPKGLPSVCVSAYPEYGQLVNRLASLYDLETECLLLTNGSDEALNVIASTFIEPGKETAIVSTPCFSMIPQLLKLAGATLCSVPVLANLAFDLQAIDTALAKGAKLAMFASPDNPTGAILPIEQLAEWCQSFPNTLFVLDEAYGEFAPASALPMVHKFENLLVTKTFSKAWGMAGLRLGVVFGQAKMIDYLKRVRLPFSVNSAAVWTAMQMLDRQQEVTRAATAAMQRKNELIAQLEKRNYQLDQGAANFLLLSAGILAGKFTESLKSQGVLVRNRSQGNLEIEREPANNLLWGKVRISIGTALENACLLDAIDSFNSSYGIIFDLDGTLVDTSTSFDKTVEELVLRRSGSPLQKDELRALRQEGGFNDDWEATAELLRRRNCAVSYADIAPEALQFYLQTAASNERLLMDMELLARLRKRHPLFIVTGRSRSEYEPIWGKTLTPYFSEVCCLDDYSDKCKKPAPDYLLAVCEKHNLKGGVYIGDSVDDMKAAENARLDRIGITFCQPADVLKQAGAQSIISSPNQLDKVFSL